MDTSNSSRVPYKFLDSYGREDKDVFFGRKRETRILLSDVVVNRLVVLFAKTGTGKTSLINAGVRPILEDRGYSTFFIRVKKNPVDSAITEINLNQDKLRITPENFAAQLEELAGRLQQPIVLFFDQFEEFFIYTSREHGETALAFISDIARIHRNRNSQVHIVFSMREEFFGEMDVFRDEIPGIFHKDSNLRLRWFDEKQAADAVRLPAGVFKVSVDDDLVVKLFEDLKSGELVEPAQLQIVCDTLWRARSGPRITLDDYCKLGQKDGEDSIAKQVLYRRLEEEFEIIQSPQQLELLAKLLPTLRLGETKRIREVAEVIRELDTDQSTLDELISQLESSRLLRRGVRDNQPVIELLHDYLVPYLEKLQAQVVTIWPRRVLAKAFNAYQEGLKTSPESNNLATAEILDLMAKYANKLTLDARQAEFLFRSSLESGVSTMVWFGLAAAKAVDVWTILKDRIDSKDKPPAYSAIRLLGQLKTSQAFQILAESFDRDELASSAIETLSDSDDVAAVELLGKALQRPKLRAQAQVALQWLSRSHHEEVVAQAQALLSSMVESEPSTNTPAHTRNLQVASIAEPPAPANWLAAEDPIKLPIGEISDLINKGLVIPFIGGGVHFANRVENSQWTPASPSFLPTSSELARYLAETVAFPSNRDSDVNDLAKVASYFEGATGRSQLRQRLHEIADRDYPVTGLHTLLARVPSALLIVTTNVDDLLERAFMSEGRPYYLVVQPTDRLDLGATVLWWRPGEKEPQAVAPNRLWIEDMNQTSVIYKLHGSVDRTSLTGDSFVITEDDHINLFGRILGQTAIPAQFVRHFRIRHFLFLGYGVHDWPLRVLMRMLLKKPSSVDRTAADDADEYDLYSWAINQHPSSLEAAFWNERRVKVYDMALSEFVSQLQRYQ